MPPRKSAPKAAAPKAVEAITHDADTRKNIPTAELQAVVDERTKKPVAVKYPRNTDLDPQLVWRGKDAQDWSDLVVHAPPLYVQDKVQPQAIIRDLMRHGRADEPARDLFSGFDRTPEGADKTDFYRHDQGWTNRMILGDSLQVMASLAEREGLRGKVQCVYFDPPYGIKFNSNFQWSTTSRDVKDGNAAHITREPEQVKAFRDTWRDGVHSYLTYLRDRLTVARDLLHESGSIFVQIGDENVHRVRAVMDEVFGESRYVNTIVFKKKSATSPKESVFDYILWYCQDTSKLKVRPIFEARNSPEEESKFNTLVTEPMIFHRLAELGDEAAARLKSVGAKWARVNYPLVSQDPSSTRSANYFFRGNVKECGAGKHWRYSPDVGMRRIERAGRLFDGGGKSLGGVVFWEDWNQIEKANIWEDMHGEKKPIYVVQTTTAAVERCLLMTTDPGDLVLDPTCGSGTTAAVSEQWGRRWITIDTSRVALALARTRIMGARYPYYLLADSPEGQAKESEVTTTTKSTRPTRGNVRLGFVYERVPRITLGAIATNAEIDVIWEKWQATLEPIRSKLNAAASEAFEEWDVPREADSRWTSPAKQLHADWWKARVARQREIDASIAAKADFEYLYDRPYEDKKKVRVAGPFTVESLSPHRYLGVDEDDELIDPAERKPDAARDFTALVLEQLKAAGVQQAHKDGRIQFATLEPYPGGGYVCAAGTYPEGETTRRAAVFVGPEFGTVLRADLVAAAREAADAGFDVLIACGFNFEAHTTEFTKLGKLPVLKARMNADLHMAGELKATGKGNLFVVFGEPDITVLPEPDGRLRVRVNGVDVFHPATGRVESSSADGIACWFLDTDYDEESFFVRHAYFLGANDPYGALKTTLKAEVDADAWATLNSDVSRPFARPAGGRIAVKVINHLGDEVMKVFRV